MREEEVQVFLFCLVGKSVATALKIQKIQKIILVHRNLYGTSVCTMHIHIIEESHLFFYVFKHIKEDPKDHTCTSASICYVSLYYAYTPNRGVIFILLCF